jgi:hypothetical protein
MAAINQRHQLQLFVCDGHQPFTSTTYAWMVSILKLSRYGGVGFVNINSTRNE